MQLSKELSLQSQGWGCPPSLPWGLGGFITSLHISATPQGELLLFGSNVITAGNILFHNSWLCFFLSSTTLLSLPICSFPFLTICAPACNYLCCCVQPSRSKFLLWRFCTQTWLPAFVIPFLKHKFMLKHGFSLKPYHIFKCRLQCALFINV